MTRWLTPGDYLIAALLLVAIAASAWFQWRSAPDQSSEAVVVERSNRLLARWSFESRIDTVAGTIGLAVIKTDARGQVEIVKAPCRDKICQMMGTLSAPGDVSACIPNELIVRIEGARSNSLDAISR